MGSAKTLSHTELRRVLDYVATRKHAERNRAMVLMTFLGGMRVGEVSALRNIDIVNSDGTVKSQIRLDSEQTKGARGRTVYLNKRLRKELAAYMLAKPQGAPEHAFFYTQKNISRGFTPNTLAQYFLDLYRRVGIDQASSHSGRRSFATKLASQGISLRVLMRLLGHQNISTTSVYIDANDDMLRDAIELA